MRNSKGSQSAISIQFLRESIGVMHVCFVLYRYGTRRFYDKTKRKGFCDVIRVQKYSLAKNTILYNYNRINPSQRKVSCIDVQHADVNK